MNTHDEDNSCDFDVFISYASKDSHLEVLHPAELAPWLESEGYTVWWDLRMQIGDPQKQIAGKVRRSRHVIALWSPRADQSRNVYFECQPAAIAKKLLPLIIEGAADILPPEWRHLHFMELPDFEAGKEAILRKLPPPTGKRAAAVQPDDARISLTGLPTAASTFIGRDAELDLLRQAWASTAPGAPNKTNAIVFHAIGGAGKSALLRQFLDTLADAHYDGAAQVYGWSAYSQGSGDNRAASADEFIAAALAFFGYRGAPILDPVERGRTLAQLAGSSRALLILDGLEPLQDMPHINGGRLKDRGLAALITGLAGQNAGLLVITSRQHLPELAAGHEPRLISRPLDRIGTGDGVALLAALGVQGKRSELEHAVDETLGHALSLNLLGAYLSAVHGGDVSQREQFRLGEIEDAPADFAGDQTARYAKRAAAIMEGAIARLEALENGASPASPATMLDKARALLGHRPAARPLSLETAILHIAGLFDRPVGREAIGALLAAPAIPGLTEVFHALPAWQRQARWNVAMERLRKLKLIAAGDGHPPQGVPSGQMESLPGGLDAHPIVRAHFGGRLKRRAAMAYTQAHGRLYDFYRTQGLPQAFRTPEAYGVLALLAAYPQVKDEIADLIGRREWPKSWLDTLPSSLLNGDWSKLQEAATLIGTPAFGTALKQFLPSDVEALRPCFSAIAHGCAAGRHQEAFSEVYFPRVSRGNDAFVAYKLGALNTDLASLAAFYDELWSILAEGLKENAKARILNSTAFALQALGRPREAAGPFEAGLSADTAAHDWKNAARAASNISELRLTLGDIAAAIAAARTSVTHADASGDAFQPLSTRTTLADALHQGGGAREALAAFEEAETMQAEMQPVLPKLYSVQGYRYCDLLLASGQPQAAIERASYALQAYAAHGYDRLLDIALDTLTLGRAHAVLAVASSQPGAGGGDARLAGTHLDAAVDGLRRAGQDPYILLGLLARAAFRRSFNLRHAGPSPALLSPSGLTGDFDAAATDLAEAFDIASRGEMRLHLADCHLEAARLALARNGTVTGGAPDNAAAADHTRAAAKLIADTGYKRRLPELEAIRACLAGEIAPDFLAPDRDTQGRPIWHELELPDEAAKPEPPAAPRISRTAPCPCGSGQRYKHCCGKLA